MDKIIVNSEVRGLGNIVIPKSLIDYGTGEYVKLSTETAEINSIPTDALILRQYLHPTLNLIKPSNFIPFVENGKFNVKLEVIDEYNKPVPNMSINCKINNEDSVVVTNSDGEATCECIMGANVKNYTIESNIPSSNHNDEAVAENITVTVGCTLNMNLKYDL